MSDHDILITELKKQIAEQLNHCCNKDNLPQLKKLLQTENGKERAESIIFSMCERDGIAVQTAMSQLETELLSDEEYDI